MQTKTKVSIAGTVAFLLVIGGEVGYIHHKNNEPAPVAKDPYAPARYEPDNDVYLRRLHPVDLKDMKDIVGKTVWISAAAQLDYYNCVGKHADYEHPVGTLPGATEMNITGYFEQVPPKTGRAVSRISAGMRHVLLSFTLPASSDPKALYAVPVGNYDNDTYTFLTDDIFFYDDPHKLYAAWGPVMWQHIDKHEPALGMTENQAMLALGEVMTPHGDTAGDRGVTYDNNAHPITIEFEKGKAGSITRDKATGA